MLWYDCVLEDSAMTMYLNTLLVLCVLEYSAMAGLESCAMAVIRCLNMTLEYAVFEHGIRVQYSSTVFKRNRDGA